MTSAVVVNGSYNSVCDKAVVGGATVVVGG